MDSAQSSWKRKTCSSKCTYKSEKTLAQNKNKSVIVMAEIKRTYIIPLRKDWLNVPSYNRAKRAAKAVKVFLKRHMKGDVKLGRRLNMLLWQHGAKRPPHHIKVDVIKDDKNIVTAELSGFVYEVKKVPEKEKGKIKETLDILTGKKNDETKGTEEKKEGQTEVKESPKEKKETKKKTPSKPLKTQ